MKARDWDRLADVYDDEVMNIFVRDRGNVVGQWLRAHGLLRGKKTNLDVGCGIGSFVKKYGRHFGMNTGVDHSRRMLRVAGRRCRTIPGCRWLQADLEHLPRSLYDSVDLVICANVISFVSEAACHRAMRVIVQCARVSGWLLIVLPALESHDAMTAYKKGRAQRPRKDASAVVRRDDRLQRFFGAKGARQLAAQAGMRSIRLQKVWYPWIDEGITRPPRGGELPWCWLLTGRR